MTPKPISECTPDDLLNHHALVYGRCKIWCHDLKDSAGYKQWNWSRWAWWKAMHYASHGSPKHASSWGIYAGHFGYTGPGDSQITHFVPMLPAPDGAPQGDDEPGGAKT